MIGWTLSAQKEVFGDNIAGYDRKLLYHVEYFFESHTCKTVRDFSFISVYHNENTMTWREY